MKKGKCQFYCNQNEPKLCGVFDISLRKKYGLSISNNHYKHHTPKFSCLIPTPVFFMNNFPFLKQIGRMRPIVVTLVICVTIAIAVKVLETSGVTMVTSCINLKIKIKNLIEIM